MSNYFYGRGEIFIGTRAADGKLEKGKTFHCPEFEVEVSDERLQHYNTSDAVKALDLDIVMQFMPKVRFVVDQYDERILALALAGETTEKTSGGSFTNQAFPTVAVGDVIPVPGGYSNLESLSLSDSAGTPADLTAGTHYTADLIKGLVTILNLGSFTQPFKAAGAENDDFEVISLANVPKAERFLRFSGINLADDDQKPVIIDLYRASLKPTKTAAKQDGSDVANWEFNPELLIDPNAPFSEAFGKFGRYVKG